MMEKVYLTAELIAICSIYYAAEASVYINGIRGIIDQHVRIGIVPPLELVTCSHVFSPQLPLNLTCKLSSPNTKPISDSGRARTFKRIWFSGPRMQFRQRRCTGSVMGSIWGVN